MKIKQKSTLEVLVLTSILGIISFVAINNTMLVEKNTSELNKNLIPTLTNLKDMRMAALNALTFTLDFVIVKNEIAISSTDDVQKMNIDLNKTLDEINTSKSHFNELFLLYKQNIPEPDHVSINKIEKKWKEFEILSDKFIKYREKGISSNEFIKIKEEFKNVKSDLFKEIDSAILETEKMSQEKSKLVSDLVGKTLIIISLTLIVFILTVVMMRHFMLKSIFEPILKIRQTTRRIASGDLKIRIENISNDEIGELSKDINQMAYDLEMSEENRLKVEKLSIIGTLAARMAHDMRNPLSIIKGGIENLRIKLEHKDTATFDIINRAIGRIDNQIEDVLDFVRITPLRIENVSLLTLLNHIVANESIPPGIKLILSDNDLAIDCDHRKIEVVIINLLRNAIDAIRPSGIIQIRWTDLGDKVRIEIEDSGHGIPEGYKTKIFDPLFTTKQRGTGLGLTSVKNIINEHGGTITFSNNPTIFSIVLPKIRTIN